jgi:uncharacterized membrane protein YozB (DUF420 family)
MIDISSLPHLNATLNFTSFVCLSLGYYFIRQGNRAAHKRCMLGAITASAVFLASYLVYHFNYPTTQFKGTGPARPVYFFILGTHIILAAAIVPLVIITLSHALREKFPQHRKIARWTLPLWWYVSVTGVLVYLMLYHLFPSR